MADEKYVNKAKNTVVGLMVGKVGGDVNVGGLAAPAEPAGLLAHAQILRQALLAARDAGRIDGATWRAADAEARQVVACLGGPGRVNKDKLDKALSRLKGLLAGMADLLQPVSVIIAAVKGM